MLTDSIYFLDYFVPLYEYHPKPSTENEKQHNAKLVYELLSDFDGFPRRCFYHNLPKMECLYFQSIPLEVDTLI